jgi:hypothetical protein
MQDEDIQMQNASQLAASQFVDVVISKLFNKR